MRDIKFRAWNKRLKEMILLENSGLQYYDFEGSYSLGFTVDGYDGFWGHEQYDTASQEASEFPIMQFTGLKDKNGIEIYEGDILSDWTETDEGIKQSYNQVFWNEYTGSWHLDNSFHQDKTCSTELWKELNDFKYEIKGNIHKNPNLIKS